jgi:hypothetical protein
MDTWTEEGRNECTDICSHKTAVIICYTPLTSDRIRLEVMSRWIHDQSMKSLLAILIPHHKIKALLIGWFFSISIHIQKFIMIWPLFRFCQMLGKV